MLIQYIRHSYNKFDYDNEGIAQRKHVIADRIRYVGKETKNLDETRITGIEEDNYLECENFMEFYDCILSLKPKDVRDMGIYERGLRNIKQKIRNGNGLKNRSKIIKILLKNT